MYIFTFDAIIKVLNYKKILIILIMFSFFTKVNAESNGSAYDYEFSGLNGNLIKLSNYKNKIIVIVKVASRCGYTSIQRLTITLV